LGRLGRPSPRGARARRLDKSYSGERKMQKARPDKLLRLETNFVLPKSMVLGGTP
jgi:hypothetical protein